ETLKPPRIAFKLPARRILDETEPHWIELVQHPHLAAKVPPLAGKCSKARKLAWIDGRTWAAGHPPNSCAGRCGVRTPPLCIPAFSRLSLPWCPISEARATSQQPLTRTSDTKGHSQL